MNYLKISIDTHDRKWSKLVRERDKRCLVCGSQNNLQAHHLFPRARNGTRFVLLNGVTLCDQDHVNSYRFSAHKTPKEFLRWARGYLGEEVFTKLEKMSLAVTTRASAIKTFHETYLSGLPQDGRSKPTPAMQPPG